METTKTAKEWFEEGYQLFSSGKYEEAIACYDKAIAIEPKDYRIWTIKGCVLGNLQRYEDAIACFDKAIEINSTDYQAWKNKGNALAYLQRYDEAIVCYDKVIKNNLTNPTNYQLWNNKGIALAYLQRYDEAITCSDKAIEINPADYQAWNLKGNLLSLMHRYAEAITYYDKAIELKADKAIYYSRGQSYILTKQYDKAGEDFFAAGKSLFHILTLGLPKEAEQQMVDSMIDKDEFFNDAIKNNIEKKKKYKDFYIQVHSLLNILHVKIKEEATASHYTSKDTMRKLLLPSKDNNPSPIRMHSVVHSNDATEGQVLMRYLYKDKNCVNDIEEGDYRALSISFNFNKDCLNQFRLYGKENGREGTGVSITVNREFFAPEIKAPTDQLMMSSEMMNKNKSQDERSALFRCIYIDPETYQLISVGHKEDYTFYRDKSQEQIEGYHEYINDVLTQVQDGLYELREKSTGLEPAIVSKLLLNLRYLTKHVAFKEEQECRIIVVKSIKDEEVYPTENYKQWYMEYNVDMQKYVEEVRFGPRYDKNEVEVFRGELAKKDINSEISKHPLV